MVDRPDEPTVLVPVNAVETTAIPRSLVELLAPLRIVVLGYHPVPDQSPPEQLRSEREADATEVAEEAAARFADMGAEVESVVVFTHDRSETIDRVAGEYGADAVLTPRPVEGELRRVFVPLRSDVNIERIVGFVGDLLRESTADATFYNVAETDEGETSGEFLLRGACDRLEEDGIDADRLDWRQDRSESPASSVVAAAEAYDLLVVGESEPSLRERILGGVTDRVVEESSKPVLVVRDV